MSARISRPSILYVVQQQMLGLMQYPRAQALETHLLELVSMRASQINGCAYCLAMHVRDLRNAGEREDRLAVLSTWRETTWFTDRERAALAWTEALTKLGEHGVSDEVFAEARSQFSEEELADLTLSIVAINGWNRLNIAFRNPPVAFEVDVKSEDIVPV